MNDTSLSVIGIHSDDANRIYVKIITGNSVNPIRLLLYKFVTEFLEGAIVEALPVLHERPDGAGQYEERSQQRPYRQDDLQNAFQQQAEGAVHNLDIHVGALHLVGVLLVGDRDGGAGAPVDVALLDLAHEPVAGLEGLSLLVQDAADLGGKADHVIHVFLADFKRNFHWYSLLQVLPLDDIVLLPTIIANSK